MCNNPKCGPHYPINPVICSDSITKAEDGTIHVAIVWPANAPFREFTLQLDQPLPEGDGAMYVDFDSTDKQPLVDRWGNTVHADQLAKTIAIRECRERTDCPCEVAQFRMRRCYDPVRIVAVCDLPRSSC